MDDIGQAIVMAGQVIIFVFGLTIAIFLYNKIMVHAEEVAEFTGTINRGDAIADVENVNQERIASRAEVILAILDLQENTYISEIKVINYTNDYTFSLDSNGELLWKVGASSPMNYVFNSQNLRNQLLNYVDGSYNVTYSEDILRYEKI